MFPKEAGSIYGTPFIHSGLRKWFPGFNCPGTQRPMYSWSKGAQLLLQLEADLGVICVLLVFQASRKQELCRGFHTDVKGRPRRTSNVW
jgi:hypothetical protein